MAAGGATWETAAPIGSQETSTPTPVGDLLPGGSSPFYSAWWKITPSVETNVLIDSNGTTGPGGEPGGEYGVDTILAVYTEAAILAADGNPDAADRFAYNDDGGDGSLSRLTLTLPPGVTYYIRLGTWDSTGDYVGAYVLRTREWVWTDWQQPPDHTAESRSWWPGKPMTQVTIGDGAAVAVGDASNGALSEAAFKAYGTNTTITIPGPTSDAGMSAGINMFVGLLKNADRAKWTWTYRARGLAPRQMSATLQMPMPYDVTPPEDEWPEGAFEVQVNPADEPVILNREIAYRFVDASYDSSLEGDGVPPRDAGGSCQYILNAGASSATIAGPLPRDTEVNGTLQPLVYKDPDDGYYDLVDLSHTFILGSVGAADPAFNTERAGGPDGTYIIGGAWYLTGRTEFSPRRVRYKVPSFTPTTFGLPPLRQVQRGDGLGSSVPRAVQNQSQQASLRAGRAFI